MNYNLLLPKLDSLRLEIPIKQCEVVGKIKIPYIKVSVEAGNIIEGSLDEPLFDLQQIHKENGITFRVQLMRRTLGNNQFEDRYILQISSKMLRGRYFEGISAENINEIYEYIQSLNILKFSKEAFMNAYAYDIDLAMDVKCSREGWLKLCRKVNANLNPSKFKYVNLFGSSDNTGLELNRREKATNEAPFVKLYHKSTEMLSKSAEFNGLYFNGQDHKIGRLEFSLKNRAHVKHLGLEIKSLFDILHVENIKLKNILTTQVRKCYMEKRIIKAQIEGRLPIKDDMLYNLIRLCIENGEDAEFFYRFAERYDGDYTEKSRYRRLIKKWIELEEFKNGLDTNLEENKEGNAVGRMLGLFN